MMEKWPDVDMGRVRLPRRPVNRICFALRWWLARMTAKDSRGFDPPSHGPVRGSRRGPCMER